MSGIAASECGLRRSGRRRGIAFGPIARPHDPDRRSSAGLGPVWGLGPCDCGRATRPYGTAGLGRTAILIGRTSWPCQAILPDFQQRFGFPMVGFRLRPDVLPGPQELVDIVLQSLEL